MTTEAIGATIFKGDVGNTNVSLIAGYHPETGMTLSGSDFGSAPRGFFGSSEYEYWRTVKPDNVQRLFDKLLEEKGAPGEAFDAQRLLSLIAARFGGTYEAEKDFREWCEAKEIPTEFYSWSSGP